MQRICLVGLILLSGLVLPLAAQKKPRHLKSNGPHWATAPLDLNLEKLPPHYIGHSLAALNALLDKREAQLTKDEFETTNAHQERVAALMRQPLQANFTEDACWAFAIPVGKFEEYSSQPEDEPIKVSYDADVNVLTVSVRLTTQGEKPDGFSLKQPTSPSTYLFFTSATFERFSEFRQAKQIKDVRYGYPPDRLLDFSFSVDVTPARAAKARLVVLFIGTLATPVRKSFSYGRRTGLNLHLEQIWFYNLDTGDILARVYPEPVIAADGSISALPEKPDVPTDKAPDYSLPFSARDVTRRAVITAKPQPPYTEEGRKNATAGTIVVRVLLGANGSVQEVEAVTQLPYGLTESALAAARRIRFTPAQKNGRNVSQWAQVEYSFNLY